MAHSGTAWESKLWSTGQAIRISYSSVEAQSLRVEYWKLEVELKTGKVDEDPHKQNQQSNIFQFLSLSVFGGADKSKTPQLYGHNNSASDPQHCTVRQQRVCLLLGHTVMQNDDEVQQIFCHWQRWYSVVLMEAEDDAAFTWAAF